MDQATNPTAWLIRKSGRLAGSRHLMRGPVTTIGRDPGNDVVFEGSDATIVSSRHVEIRLEGDSYRIVDLNSTNGTYVDGERVVERTLADSCSIQLGAGGPELKFEMSASPVSNLDKTLALPATDSGKPGHAGEEPAAKAARGKASSDREHEQLLSDAVTKARMARRAGAADQTIVIMREMLGTAIHRSGKKFKLIIGGLALALVAVTGYGFWRIQELKREKSDIDAQIQQIETRLRAGGQNPKELDQLIDRLNRYQNQALTLQGSLFYKLGVRGHEQAFVEREIKTLMAEFGAESYSIPPEFVEQVDRFIKQYQGQDRPKMDRAVGRARKDLETIQRLFEAQHLPPDLAYMVLVESAFISESSSPAGAAGLWQFTPETARAYGMKVTAEVDERFDLSKSTLAASRYVRDLILDFGTGSSVMLALAAYNLGPGKVRQAVRKVQDPIKQRNFWYLYRVRALPTETREYVPKIIAAIIVGRNLDRFGF